MRARKALSLFLCLTLTAAAGCGRPSAPPDSSAAAQPEGSAAGTDVSAAADAEPEGTPWDSEESLEWYCELSRKTNPGDLSRTVEFLRRAQAGEELTVGFIGGSITQGAPGPGARYLYPRLVCNWLEEQYPQSSFELVNVAVGATDSLYGVHRADGQLLSADPDLVFVEYSANDPLEPLYDETYESLCRKILNWRTKPALMTVSMCWADFKSTLPIHVKTNRYYDIPLIGYRDAVYMGVMSGKFPWSKQSDDTVHPNRDGHWLAAQFIIYRLREAQGMMDTADPPEETLPPARTANRFEDAAMLWSKTVGEAAAAVPDAQGDFAPAALTDFFDHQNGWVCAEPHGEPMTFTVTAGQIGIVFLQYKDGGAQDGARFTVTLDKGTAQEQTVELSCTSGDEEPERTLNVVQLLDGEAGQTHTLEIAHNDDDGRVMIVGIMTAARS